MEVSIKHASLVCIVLLTTIQSLVLHYAQIVSPEHFLPIVAVFFTEIGKLSTCFLLVFMESGFNCTKFFATLKSEIIEKPLESSLLFIPAGLYTLQNNLIYISLKYLDAALYQIVYQCRIITTTFFSVCILHKKVSLIQWFSVLLLTVGVILVQPTSFTSVLISAFTSGFAGVYFEKLLKEYKSSIWIKNIQLSVFSLILCVISMVYQYRPITINTFMYGFNKWTWACILIQTCSGLLVAIVMKYADNILKVFAAAISIILSIIYILFLYFAVGTSFVLVATFLYSVPINKRNAIMEEKIAEEEKNLPHKHIDDENNEDNINSTT